MKKHIDEGKMWRGGLVDKASWDGQLLDITGADAVEVEVKRDGKVLWVNVCGICRLRVCQIDDEIVIRDKRPKKK